MSEAHRRGLLIPGLVAAVALAGLVALGLWQLERKTWKENLIATIEARQAASPTELPSRARWASLNAATDEFRRVSLHAQIVPDTEGRVYAAGSTLRADIKGPGYFAFGLARLRDGSKVVVNRGFVANPNPDAGLRPLGVPQDAIDIVGSLRFPEQPGWFVTPYSDRQDLWLVRDPRAMAARYHWGEVAPFYVEQESPVPPGGLPQPGALTVRLPDNHLQYALTWFGLAGVLAVSFLVWAFSRRRSLA